MREEKGKMTQETERGASQWEEARIAGTAGLKGLHRRPKMLI